MTKKTLTLLLALILVFSLTTAAFAVEEEVLPCEGDQVAGTLVDFDPETNTATVDTGEGLCTVTFNQDYGHPITTLLASYFGSFNPGELTENLENTMVCVLEEEGAYSLFIPEEGEECPGTMGTVIGENEDGTFQVVLGEGEEAEEVTMTVDDEEQANGLTEALESLNVEWNLNEDGSASDTGDDIAQYHDDGYGFGVIVKVYGIAEASQEACEGEEAPPEEPVEEGAPEGEEPPAEEPCGVTVEELFEQMENGASIGQLFKMYGKPSLLGVGHVRKNMNNSNGMAEEGLASDSEEGSQQEKSNSKGICNARSKGGKAKAKGHGEVVCNSNGD